MCTATKVLTESVQLHSQQSSVLMHAKQNIQTTAKFCFMQRHRSSQEAKTLYLDALGGGIGVVGGAGGARQGGQGSLAQGGSSIARGDLVLGDAPVLGLAPGKGRCFAHE